MQPDERDAACLWDMLERAQRVQGYMSDKTFYHYTSNQGLQDAVERCVEVIGEAANRVSGEFKQAHPEIPWRLIIAQRHILAHEYDEIRPERIYRVATTHIPELVEKLQPLIPPYS
ncbi:MAG: DUF86 domain-containing protein [Phycisphaerae bacterium]|nr:DUF86 domain-containing protein [Phycisphaerae bacterium]